MRRSDFTLGPLVYAAQEIQAEQISAAFSAPSGFLLVFLLQSARVQRQLTPYTVSSDLYFCIDAAAQLRFRINTNSHHCGCSLMIPPEMMGKWNYSNNRVMRWGKTKNKNDLFQPVFTHKQWNKQQKENTRKCSFRPSVYVCAVLMFTQAGGFWNPGCMRTWKASKVQRQLWARTCKYTV